MNFDARDRRPTWWLLYAISLLLIGLLGLVEATVPGAGVREALEIPVVVLVFGLMVGWARRNRAAIAVQDVNAHHRPQNATTRD